MDLDSLASHHFKLPYLRPFQRLVINTIAENDQTKGVHPPLMVILPTGSGKSLCFMLPALFVKGLVVIVYPLLSLMEDQRRRFKDAAIRCVTLKGGQSGAERQQIFAEIDEGCKVVITNAETLNHPTVLAQLGRKKISLLVIDEAHTIITWGEGFRPKLSDLGPIARHLNASQLLLFTATADEAVMEGITRLFGKPHSIRGSSDRPNITYHVIKTLSQRRTLTTLLQEPDSRPALIFCPTRLQCELMQAHYQSQNPTIESRWYHAGLPKGERLRRERWFIDSQQAVLFSTNAFGMGVDKKDIRTVVHLKPPVDVLSYLQESGRAGRDTKPSHAIILMDRPLNTPLGELFWSKGMCYRKELLALLNEEIEYCSGCDYCNDQQRYRREGEEPILAAVRARPFLLTRTTLTALLTKESRFERHSGHLKEWHAAEIREAITTLIEEKALQEGRYSGRLYRPLLSRAR